MESITFTLRLTVICIRQSPTIRRGRLNWLAGKTGFYKPYTASTLLQTEDPGGIDAEVFIDDDGQAYVFWGRRHVAKLAKDMITVDSVVHVISTPRKEYSEGPIFFKRKGIYYYLYTIGGDERYQYAYVMSNGFSSRLYIPGAGYCVDYRLRTRCLRAGTWLCLQYR